MGGGKKSNLVNISLYVICKNPVFLRHRGLASNNPKPLIKNNLKNFLII